MSRSGPRKVWMKCLRKIDPDEANANKDKIVKAVAQKIVTGLTH
jgi:hypothetical protein